MPSPPSYFTSRDDILDKLEDLLFSNQQSSQQLRIALIGPKGTGKNSIARIFVHRMREQSSDCSVFWVNASTENSIEKSYNAIVGEFGDLPEWTGSVSDRVHLFLHHLTWTFNGRWLVVLDGLQRQTALYLCFENLLPQGLNGSLLFTALDLSCFALLGPVEVIQVQKLHDETAIQLENVICLQNLRVTDPRDDKKRIEDTKGGLLEGSYRWILENSNFQRWRDDEQIPLLWIKGGPGKGKTMLLCGIINELNKSMTKTDQLSYFFCQVTDSRLNNATAMLRGLLYFLIDQQPSLISHIRKKYDQAGQSVFEDANAWFALSDIFTNILQDTNLKMTYLVIDALDECVVDLPKLLDLVVHTSASSVRVKWLVSSRNEMHIEQKLRCVDAKARLSLELTQNVEQVSRAIDVYIDNKLSHIESLQDDGLRVQVRDILRQKANGTFLWVALVVRELENLESWDPLQVVEEAPSGLYQLYDRKMNQIQQLQQKNSEICRLLLSTACIAYRPLYLAEIGSLCGLSGQVSVLIRNVTTIADMCGSFLTVRDDQVYLVHHSAKDYLSVKMRDAVFPSQSGIHYDIFFRSLKLMSSVLKRDIYGLVAPGFPIDKVQAPVDDPLAIVRYSCVHWVDHLYDWNSSSTSSGINSKVKDAIEDFIKKKYLYWLEALSLYRSMSEGVLAMVKLYALVQVTTKAATLYINTNIT